MDNLFVATLLKELMTEYNRVSLPCLGSFLGQYKPSYISDDGIIMPPSKKIAFHQNEIWNDEKLEKLIAQREHVSLGEAKERLAFWIDEVCVLLATGEQVELPDMGRLKVAGGARLVFEQDSPNLLRESFGLQPVPLAVQTPFKPVNTAHAGKTEPKQPLKNKKRIIIAIAALLLLLVCAAGIYFYVIEPRASRAKQPDKQAASFTLTSTKYCILLGNYEKYNEARASAKAAGAHSGIFYVPGKMPYVVSIGEFASLREANDSLAALRNRDSLFTVARVAEIDPAREAVND